MKSVDTVKFRDRYDAKYYCMEINTSKFSKRYNANDLKRLEKLIKEDTEKLTKLRESIIAEKNKAKK